MAEWTDLQRRLWEGLGLPQDSTHVIMSRVTPVILLDDLTENPSRDPAMYRPWIGQLGVSAAAGSQSSIQVINPAGSGRIVTIERITFSQSNTLRVYGLAALIVSVGGQLNDAGTVKYMQPRDNRIRHLCTTRMYGSNDAGAVVQAAAASMNFVAVANTLNTEPLDIILDEGQGATWTGATVNVALSATIYGVEVPKIKI